MGEVLKKFGRYFLLDHIAQGGMAEIYRARLASADGAGRLMVIKRIQAGFGANAEFLQMFKSEIKVTMGFNHPNIVQLYDFGEFQEQPYIAMEMVDGRNLRQFISRFSELKQSFPIELATFIVEQAASGLHYAHSFKDKISGEPLNIVHRDISPQNILISYEGNVKVIDFGIAKATTNSESTRAGVIKGKPSYLSPEQISGDVLDGRSDIFALGAVLWEILTGKKLFAGENDLAVLKLIESCQTHVKPPSTINPKIPKELDYIVLRTLTKQREKRYQSAEELQRALHKFLYSFMPEFNPSDLAYYAKDLFKNEIVDDRKRIQKLNEKAEVLLALDTGHSSEESAPTREDATVLDASKKDAGPSKPRETNITVTQEEWSTKIEFEVPQNRAKTPTPEPVRLNHPTAPNASKRASHTTDPHVSTPYSSAPKQRKPSPTTSNQSPKKIGIGALGVILLLSLFGPEFGINIPILSDLLGSFVVGSEAKLFLQGNQKGVTVAVNGQTVATALPATINGLTVGTPFRVTVTGSNGSFQQEVTLKKGEKKSIQVNLSNDKGLASSITPGNAPPLPGEKSILLKFNFNPGGGSANVSVNGRTVDGSNTILVALDSPLELTVERNGFKSFKREFVLESKQVAGLREWLMDIQLEPLKFGYITLHTTPSSDAMIPFENGTSWKRKTPLENEKLPVGKYTIRLTNEVLGMEKTIHITIEEGKAINIDEKLEIGK